MPDNSKKIHIYSDGGCRGNPGHGAWAAVLTDGKNRRVIGGAASLTTNNKMEITAAIEGLRALKGPSNVFFVSDSKYTLQGITDWIHGWKKRDWKTANKKPVKNKELWQALEAEASKHKIEWSWTKGHAGHDENEECDEVVNLLMDRIEMGEDPKSIKFDERGFVD
ncbi:MAG: ribonuclease HI [Planctomycetota bacterium]|nr:ribonuclease HI [Planctomycetota bacterium]MDA1140765.1 ribonuclease HI [Planctomycetota bacterium]